MSTKRTSTEFSLEEQTIGSVLQQEDGSKRVKHVSLSDTTLQDLPIELLECILIKVVTMEVKDARLVKSMWMEKADVVIDRLNAVCSHWSNVLTTYVFRKRVSRILEAETIRLEILHHAPFDIFALDVTTLNDEIFVLERTWRNDYAIHVFDRDNVSAAKTAIPSQGLKRPRSLAACSVSNCVYLVDNEEWLKKDSVLRITKDDNHQFNISAFIIVPCLSIPDPAVTATGDLVLTKHRTRNSEVISIDVYDANGSLQHEILVCSEIFSLCQIIPMANGNLLLVSRTSRKETKLTEIDLHCTLRQYVISESDDMAVGCADLHGRMLMIKEQSNKFMLFDSEFNLQCLTCPQLDECYLAHPYKLRYNRERNEIISFFAAAEFGISALTVFRLTEE